MKYNVGDKVKIISRERLSRFPMDSYGDYDTGKVYFVRGMFRFCSKTAIITSNIDCYKIDLDDGVYNWADEMFEDSDVILDVSYTKNLIPIHDREIRRSSILDNLEID